MKITISEAPSHYFNDDTCEDFIKRQFKVGSIDGLGIEDDQEDILISVGALLQYLHETQKNSLDHINRMDVYSIEDYMIIDSSSRRNLELTETLRDKQKRGSLLWVMDKTKTAMGARMLRNMIEQPLIHKDDTVGNISCKIHFMSNDHHGDMLLSKILDNLQDLTGQFRILSLIHI